MRAITVVAALGVAGVAIWAVRGRSAVPGTIDSAGGSVAMAANGPPVPSTAPPPPIEPAAMNALDLMGNYLRTLRNFEVEAVVTTEDVLEDGQKVQLVSNVRVVAARPNKLRAELTSDRKERLFIYDGKTFALFAPRQKFYSTIPAPGTINELATLLEEKYDVDLPLVDLFRWGTSPAQKNAITAAKDIGPATIDGVTANQYAFRQNGMDWQVWIQAGGYPLPLKLVLTTLSDDARPQHTAEYTWNLAPSFNDGAFVVDAPEGYNKIAMAEARAQGQVKQPGEPKK